MTMDTDPSPQFTSERFIPPTEVRWSVEDKGDLVHVTFEAENRRVNEHLLLSPEDAILLADHLEEVAG